MSERTDERTTDSKGDVDVEDILDDGDSAGSGDALGPGGASAGDGDPLADEEDLGVDVEALTGDPDTGPAGPGSTGSGSESSGLLSGLVPSVSLPNPLAALPSGRSVLLTFGAVLVSVLLASSVPLLGGVFGAPVGIFAGAFALGAASGTSRYLEFALAGALVSGLGAFQGSLFRVAVFSDVGFAPVFAIAAGFGLVVALLGHYFGRDLRSGLTSSIE
jgi:hypothetical protein